ncbi:MAG TPA: transcriptional regulator GcvA [Polyangiaceae bacterium]|nr:transcriptional regulator GcvA [Polyangiaceae bacterium]
MHDSDAPGKAPPLPSLHALQVFDAAAQRLSFTAAARDLHVTQTAVSHQIRSLEAELGTALFRRMPRKLALTDAGQAWATELRQIFLRLEHAHQRLRARARSQRPVVALSTLPSFGSRWLVPRLGRFLSLQPEVEVRVSATDSLVDFELEPIDLAIRFGGGHYPHLFKEKLADDSWLAVCSPAFLSRHKLKSPADLEHHSLLQDSHVDAWPRWFAAQRKRLPQRLRYTQLTDSSMVVEAAILGQGVALARRSLSLDELGAGRLVLPFPKVAPVPTGLAYYLVGPRENFKRAEIAAFRSWIRQEARSLR